MKIHWKPLIERHVLGTCSRGKIWIRLDSVGKVTGIYTLFGETQKFVPADEHEEELECAKLVAETVLDNLDFAEYLAKINN